MNPLFQSFKTNQAAPTNGNIPAPPQNLGQMLNQVAQFFMPYGMTPEQIVRQKIQNGEMTQQQFDQFAQIANSWTGRNG
jgi:uncharacterized protein with von Willebrand factor type A (vWA) domain